MTDVFAWAGPWFYAAQHNRTSAFILDSVVINIVSNIPGGYWVILLAKDILPFLCKVFLPVFAVLHTMLFG